MPKLPWFPGESRGILRWRPQVESRPFPATLRLDLVLQVLLAMQKVEGSNPFSRFGKPRKCGVFSCGDREAPWHRHETSSPPPAHAAAAARSSAPGVGSCSRAKRNSTQDRRFARRATGSCAPGCADCLAGLDPDDEIDLRIEDLVDQLLVGGDAHLAAAVAVVADLLILVLLHLEPRDRLLVLD